MIYVFAAGDAKFQQSDSQRLTATYRDSQEHTDTQRLTHTNNLLKRLIQTNINSNRDQMRK